MKFLQALIFVNSREDKKGTIKESHEQKFCYSKNKWKNLNTFSRNSKLFRRTNFRESSFPRRFTSTEICRFSQNMQNLEFIGSFWHVAFSLCSVILHIKMPCYIMFWVLWEKIKLWLLVGWWNISKNKNVGHKVKNLLGKCKGLSKKDQNFIEEVKIFQRQTALYPPTLTQFHPRQDQ